MRLIDADAIHIPKMETGFDDTLMRIFIANTPTIVDAVKVVRCKECVFWVCGYITDQDDFIPPKCGKYMQMVGHSSDDFCPYGERREVTE